MIIKSSILLYNPGGIGGLVWWYLCVLTLWWYALVRSLARLCFRGRCAAWRGVM